MVWWIDNYQTSHCISGPHHGLNLESDIVFQTGNIMFNMSCEKSYDAYEMYSLVCTGVNIFNVDRTFYDGDTLQEIETLISSIEAKPVMFPEEFKRLISLSVTMSVENPVDITDRIDIIILKDVTNVKQVTEFRKLNLEYESIPIILWLGILESEATNELIKISNGIILDTKTGIFNDLYYSCIQKCFKARRPVFYSNPDVIPDYYGPTGNDRKLMIFAEQLVEARFQGVVLKDSNELNFAPTELVNSLVKAVHIAELSVDVEKDFYKKRFEVPTPVLPPVSIAYAASLAALKCGASAILVLTATGQSAKIISFASPTCHIIAITTRKEAARRLQLYRRVIPVVYNRERGHSWRDECRNRIGFGTAFALSARLLDPGAKLVVLLPTEESSGYCDGFQIVTVPLSCDE